MNDQSRRIAMSLNVAHNEMQSMQNAKMVCYLSDNGARIMFKLVSYSCIHTYIYFK